MTVYGPNHSILHTVNHQSSNQFELRPSEVGKHSICFSHAGSYEDKDLDVDIEVKKLEGHPDLKSDATTVANPLDPAAALAKKLESSGENLNRELVDIIHTLRHLRNRERRNMETVESIGSHMKWFTIFEVALITGMSIVQIVILRSFFTSTGSVRV